MARHSSRDWKANGVYASAREVYLRILGISGLANSADYKALGADLEPGEHRIRQGLDAAAALLVDGEIVAAAAEERAQAAQP